MARIAGVNIPVNKHAWIGLTSIYGVGRSSARKVCSAAGVNPATKVKSLTESEVERLRAENLVREAEPDAAVAVPPDDGAVREAYEPPQMHVYSDMRDLLMLDPIHDVATEGWPTRPAEELKQAG